ncbi:MAG TPA: hypothetical protein VJZ27_08380, partial [Aggregatilineales bacterium]|nr:hypothetical protein [Aggregatilineales bacterium]
VLEANLGTVNFGEEVDSELEAPATTAVYTIPASAGEEVSVQLQVGNRAALFEVYNGEGQVLPADKELVKQNTSFGIYTLAGEEPYTLKFDADRGYKVTVHSGNVLIAHPDDLVMNEDVRGSLDFPAEQAVYTIERNPGAVISVALQDGSQPRESELRDADGNVLEFDAEITKNSRNYRIYTLTGSAPYALQFVTGGRYTLNVSDGNVLRADKGVIRFGNQATDQLTQPQEAAIYIVDAVPGQVISLSLQDRSNRDGELLDAEGNIVLPFGKAALNNRRFTAYELTGTGPYTFTFFPQGRYTLGLVDGNIFRSDQDSIPFGSSVSTRLQIPARIAVYHIYTTADQVISLTVADRGREYVIPNLYNADGEKIEPFAEVFEGTSTYSGVYVLQGSPPYTVDFETINQFTFSMRRGNITEIETEELGPVAPVVQEELITSAPVEE